MSCLGLGQAIAGYVRAAWLRRLAGKWRRPRPHGRSTQVPPCACIASETRTLELNAYSKRHIALDSLLLYTYLYFYTYTYISMAIAIGIQNFLPPPQCAVPRQGGHRQLIGPQARDHLAFTRYSFVVTWGCVAVVHEPTILSFPPPTSTCIVQYSRTIIGQYTTPLPNSRLYTIHHAILVITISCKGQVITAYSLRNHCDQRGSDACVAYSKRHLSRLA